MIQLSAGGAIAWGLCHHVTPEYGAMRACQAGKQKEVDSNGRRGCGGSNDGSDNYSRL